MSVFVGPLFPDELAWGLPGRVVERFPTVASRNLPEFFADHRPSGSKLFPTKLAAMAASMTFKNAPSAEYIARHHTFYPFAAVLLDQPMANRLLCSLVRIGNTARGPQQPRDSTDTGVRVCLACIETDRSMLGFAYPHRLHQVPTLRRCHIHNAPLHLTDMSWEGAKLQFLHRAQIASAPMPCASGEIQGLLCRAYECVAHYTGPLPLRSALFRSVKDLLIAANLTTGSPDSAGAIAELLEKKFGRGTLSELGLESLAASAATVLAILANGKRPPRDIAIHHLALLASLAGSDFATAFQVAVQPRAKGSPWPCMAAGTACSGKRLIFKFERRKYKDGLRGRFCCPECATVYARTLPLQDNPDGSFVHQVTTNRVLPPWSQRLGMLWVQPEQTWKSLMAELKLSRWRIQTVALAMRLPSMPGRRLPKKIMFPEQFKWAAKRAEKRARLVALLQANPNTEWRRLERKSRYLLEWFYKHDPDFLASIRSQTHPRGDVVPFTSMGARADEQNAAYVSQHIGKARERLLQDSRRITVVALLRALASDGHPVVVGCQHVATRALLRKSAESREDHFRRQFACLQQTTPPGVRPKGLLQLLRNHRLGDYYYSYHNHSPEFRSRIDAYFSRPSRLRANVA